MTESILEGEPDDWARELREAGWTAKGLAIWVSPGGIMYRGPAHALRMKRAHPELEYLTMEDIAETMPDKL
jgi:hypothetical protein